MRFTLALLSLVLVGCADRADESRSRSVPPATNPFASIDNIMVGAVDKSPEEFRHYNPISLMASCANEFIKSGLTAFPADKANGRNGDCHFVITTYILPIPAEDKTLIVSICTLSTFATTQYGASGWFEMYTDSNFATIAVGNDIDQALREVCVDSVKSVLRYRSLK